MFLVFFSFLFLSCSNSKKTYTIGVSQCSEDNWRDKLNGELRDATYLHDNVKLHVVSANDNDKQQIGQINAFTDRGIDLLIVSPNQVNSVTPAVDRAYDKGIPVILFDRKTGSGKYTAFVGADNEKIGHTIGEHIATRLGGKGTVAEIRGLEGSSPAIERHRGFVEAIKLPRHTPCGRRRRHLVAAKRSRSVGQDIGERHCAGLCFRAKRPHGVRRMADGEASRTG